MCGHSNLPRTRAIDQETRDLRAADRLISEAHDMLERIRDRLAKSDPDKSELIILMNALDNFRRRDEPIS